MKSLLLACLCAFPLAALGGDDKAGKITGTYTIASGQRDGKPLPKSDFEGSVVTVTEDKIVGIDKDRKDVFACTYTLDRSGSPWTIRMTSTAPKKGEKTAGVVEVEGDTMRICYALPGGKTPTGFKAGENQHSFVLKRKSP